MASHSLSIGRKFIVFLVAVTLPFLLVEGTASLFMAVQQTAVAPMPSHARYDEELGWICRPNVRIDSLYGPGLGLTTNAQGLRAKESYTPAVPPGRFRVICLGDSFTQGYGVSDEETYPAQMEAACPRVQAINMGQVGYGIDQAYLWYKRDGAKLQADVLLFAFINNDFWRMSISAFRGYPKPMLRARGGQLHLENVPVPRRWAGAAARRRAMELVRGLAVTRSAYWLKERLVSKPDLPATTAHGATFYQPSNEDTLAAAGLVFQDLARLSKERGQQLVLVYLPSDLVIEPSVEAQWLTEFARTHDLRLFNLVAEFGRLPPWELARLFLPHGHYTREGNRLVAEAMLRRLRDLNPPPPDCPR